MRCKRDHKKLDRWNCLDCRIEDVWEENGENTGGVVQVLILMREEIDRLKNMAYMG